MKKILLSLFLTSTIIGFTQAQQLTPIASPSSHSGFGSGYFGQPILDNSSLYLRYQGDDDNYDLFEFNGSSLTEVPSPTGFTGPSKGYHGLPIATGSSGVELLLQYKDDNNTYMMFKYDGTDLTELTSPIGFTGINKGYIGAGIEYSWFVPPMSLFASVFTQYTGSDNHNYVCTYDIFGGVNQMNKINTPSGYTGSGRGYVGSPINHNNILHLHYLGSDGNYDLMKYDQGSFVSVPSPSGFTTSGKGYAGGAHAVLNSDLYLRYYGDDGNYDLFKYNGSTLTEIPSPTGFTDNLKGYSGEPIVMGSNLYLRYEGNDGNFDLFKYDGTTLTEIPSPTGFTASTQGYHGNPVVFNGNLYLKYRGDDNNYDLFKYDGTNLTEISSPTGFTSSLTGYFGNPIEFNSKLYLQYKGSNSNIDLFEFDGTNLTEISSPTGYSGANAGYYGNPIVMGESLYLQYKNDAGSFDLMRFCIPDTLTNIEISACNNYTSAGGKTWTTTGIYYDTLTSASGCDSIVTVDLIISSIDISTTNSDATITANNTSATYQWVDCNNGNSAIDGETSQSFTATSNGNYACIINEGDCSLTSACTEITTFTGLKDERLNGVQIYPNPVSHQLVIEMGTLNSTSIEVLDFSGRTIKTLVSNERSIDVSDLVNGVYFLKIEINNEVIHKHFIKN